MPSSTLDFLLPERSVSDCKLILMPSPILTNKILLLRVTFKSDHESVCYDLIRFTVVGAGEEQFEIKSTSVLPFVLAFTLPLSSSGEGNLNIWHDFAGKDIKSASKAIRAMSLLKDGGSVELYSLDFEVQVTTFNVSSAVPEDVQAWGPMIADAARVSEIYGVDLSVPKAFTVDDGRAVFVLLALEAGDLLPIKTFEAQLVKSDEHEAAVFRVAGQKFEIIAHLPRIEPSLTVFGTLIDSGPIALEVTGAEIDEAEDFAIRYASADYGASVPVRFLFTEVRGKREPFSNGHMYFRPLASAN